MEKSIKKSSSSSNSKLKHRFSRMLLCSTSVVPSSACPQHLESELDRHHFHCRRKLLSNGRSLPRGSAAPVVRVSISCGTMDASEPLLPSLLNKKEIITYEKRSKIDLERSIINRRRNLGAYDFTSSSSDDRLNLFSSDEEEEDGKETQSLLSPRSFSSDIYRRTRKRENSNTRSRTVQRIQRPSRRQLAAKHPAGLRPLISEKEEKVKKRNEGGFAVVKRTTDPYTDFRCSMVEMIVERGMSSARELEHLLDAYLALNLPRHHEVILEAFADICAAMFGNTYCSSP